MKLQEYFLNKEVPVGKGCHKNTNKVWIAKENLHTVKTFIHVLKKDLQNENETRKKCSTE